MAADRVEEQKNVLWDEYQEAIRANRRGGQMYEIAQGHPDVVFDYSGNGDPWTELFGALKGDEYFDDWRAAIADYRSRCDVQIQTARELARF